jgi:hypothetical protein
VFGIVIASFLPVRKLENVAGAIKMRKFALRLILTTCLGLSAAGALAVPIEILPSDQEVELGSQVSVDIVIDPRGDAFIGAYDFIVNFDDTLLSFASAIFGGALGGDSFDSFAGVIDFGAGQVNLSEFSFLFDLSGLQDRQPFILATVLFDTLDIGTSDLYLSDIILGDDFGFPLSAQPVGGRITIIEPPVSVPEPATWLLLISGLGLLLMRRRQWL